MYPRAKQDHPAQEDTCPIDLDHLARQTHGDAALEREVLGLFIRQVLSVRDKLEGADGESRAQLAHSLVGASRAVGAFTLADAAAELEGAPQSIPTIKLLFSLLDEISAFVSERLG